MTNPSDGTEKDLLDELMGKGADGAGKISESKQELPDGPLPPVPSPTAELDVAAQPPKSAVAAQDAVHATDAGGEGYSLVIEGQAYTKDDKGNKAEVPYKTTIKIAKLEGAMALLRKVSKNGGDSFLDATVRKIIGANFRGVRTYNIVGATPINPAKTPMPSNLQFMTGEQLVGVVAERRIPIKVADYEGDVVALRDSVMDFFLNPQGFKERETKRSADRAERKELEKLNA